MSFASFSGMGVVCWVNCAMAVALSPWSCIWSNKTRRVCSFQLLGELRRGIHAAFLQMLLHLLMSRQSRRGWRRKSVVQDGGEAQR